mmetsp:Transcript_61209/g.162701  ORF Transcript_61209/g.162701 Transcript_61209/m.162701 type:complete len:905 (-) Transcript_61209:437-3151(-)
MTREKGIASPELTCVGPLLRTALPALDGQPASPQARESRGRRLGFSPSLRKEQLAPTSPNRESARPWDKNGASVRGSESSATKDARLPAWPLPDDSAQDSPPRKGLPVFVNGGEGPSPSNMSWAAVARFLASGEADKTGKSTDSAVDQASEGFLEALEAVSNGNSVSCLRWRGSSAKELRCTSDDPASCRQQKETSTGAGRLRASSPMSPMGANRLRSLSPSGSLSRAANLASGILNTTRLTSSPRLGTRLSHRSMPSVPSVEALRGDSSKDGQNCTAGTRSGVAKGVNNDANPQSPARSAVSPRQVRSSDNEASTPDTPHAQMVEVSSPQTSPSLKPCSPSARDSGMAQVSRLLASPKVGARFLPRESSRVPDPRRVSSGPRSRDIGPSPSRGDGRQVRTGAVSAAPSRERPGSVPRVVPIHARESRDNSDVRPQASGRRRLLEGLQSTRDDYGRAARGCVLLGAPEQGVPAEERSSVALGVPSSPGDVGETGRPPPSPLHDFQRKHSLQLLSSPTDGAPTQCASWAACADVKREDTPAPRPTPSSKMSPRLLPWETERKASPPRESPNSRQFQRSACVVPQFGREGRQVSDGRGSPHLREARDASYARPQVSGRRRPVETVQSSRDETPRRNTVRPRSPSPGVPGARNSSPHAGRRDGEAGDRSPSPLRELSSRSAGEDLPKKIFLQRGGGKSVSGAPMQVVAQDACTGKVKVGLLPFLRGTGVDFGGRRLEEVLAWDYEKLESRHDYIQWLFPTDEASRWNVGAPLVTPKVQMVMRSDASVKENIRKSFKTFLGFLGLDVVRKDHDTDGRGSLTVQKSPGFEDRVPTCWKSSFMRKGGNHNWLRISRVLHCLRLTGLDAEAGAFHSCLETLHAHGLPCGSSIDHWRRNASLEFGNSRATEE